LKKGGLCVQLVNVTFNLATGAGGVNGC
jgi:hypothetical protein